MASTPTPTTQSTTASCAALSWVTLEGQNSGTGNGRAGAVVFFHRENLITDPAPLQFPDIASVERSADHGLRVTYRSDVTHRLTGRLLQGDEQLPAG